MLVSNLKDSCIPKICLSLTKRLIKRWKNSSSSKRTTNVALRTILRRCKRKGKNNLLMKGWWSKSLWRKSTKRKKRDRKTWPLVSWERLQTNWNLTSIAIRKNDTSNEEVKTYYLEVLNNWIIHKVWRLKKSLWSRKLKRWFKKRLWNAYKRSLRKNSRICLQTTITPFHSLVKISTSIHTCKHLVSTTERLVTQPPKKDGLNLLVSQKMKNLKLRNKQKDFIN